jgi:hypothetical protein
MAPATGVVAVGVAVVVAAAVSADGLGCDDNDLTALGERRTVL